MAEARRRRDSRPSRRARRRRRSHSSADKGAPPFHFLSAPLFPYCHLLLLPLQTVISPCANTSGFQCGRARPHLGPKFLGSANMRFHRNEHAIALWRAKSRSRLHPERVPCRSRANVVRLEACSVPRRAKICGGRVCFPLRSGPPVSKGSFAARVVPQRACYVGPQWVRVVPVKFRGVVRFWGRLELLECFWSAY